MIDHGKSHIVFMNKIADVLIDAGHNLTIVQLPVAPFIRLNATSKATRIIPYINENIDFSYVRSLSTMSNIFKPNRDPYRDVPNLFKQKLSVCEAVANDDDLIRDLNSTKFDMGITEVADTCQEGLFHVLGIHNVLYTCAVPIQNTVYRMYGIPEIPSFMTSMVFPFSHYMSYWERFQLFKTNIKRDYLIGKLESDMTECYRKKYGPDFPHLAELRQRKANFIFLNSNEHLDFPNMITPKIKYIGGLESPDILPISEELESIIKKYKGFVVFSLGTIYNMQPMPMTTRKAILSSFNKFPDYAFIWKFDKGGPDGWDFAKGYSNVYLQEWLPQISLLNHPKCKIFISHTGYNSFQESILAGVPIISIPIAFDQPHNAAVAREKKLGLTLDIHDLNESDLTNTLKEMLTDFPSIYHVSTKKMRERIIDSMKIMSPKDIVLKYFDYASKYGSLPDMNLGSSKLNFFQRYLLDIFIPLFVVIILILYFIIYTLKLIWSKLFKKQKSKKE